MRIGIISVHQEQPGGVSNVIRGTVSELLLQSKTDHFFQMGEDDGLRLGLPWIQAPYDSRGVNLNFAALAENINIIHSMYSPFHIGKGVPCAKIYTIHDMIPYLHPEWFEKSFGEKFNHEFRRCAEESDIIIAVSENTRKDIIEGFRVDEKKVICIYNGLNYIPALTEDAVDMQSKGLPEEPFLLSVSAFDSYKNQDGLIRAFLQYKEHHIDNPIKLVLTGNIRNRMKTDEKLINNPLYEKNVIFTGYVSEEELRWLYRHADAFAYISLYEGFGLPILEAMAHGRAVIASNTSSMPEVGGDAVEYCNPYNADSIECAINNLFEDTEKRQELEKKAVLQAKKFSYYNTARELLEIYHNMQ